MSEKADDLGSRVGHADRVVVESGDRSLLGPFQAAAQNQELLEYHGKRFIVDKISSISGSGGFRFRVEMREVLGVAA